MCVPIISMYIFAPEDILLLRVGRDGYNGTVVAMTTAAKYNVISDAFFHLLSPALNCPQGQVYLQCGNSCNLTCRSLSYPDEECSDVCLEGCFCPPGLYQDERGDCVPKAQCPCYYDGELFQPADIFSDHHTMW